MVRVVRSALAHGVIPKGDTSGLNVHSYLKDSDTYNDWTQQRVLIKEAGDVFKRRGTHTAAAKCETANKALLDMLLGYDFPEASLKKVLDSMDGYNDLIEHSGVRDTLNRRVARTLYQLTDPRMWFKK